MNTQAMDQDQNELATEHSSLGADSSNLSLVDDEQAWSLFSKPHARIQGYIESSVIIQGMHCAACAGLIEQAVAKVPGVQDITVNAANHRAKIVWHQSQTKPSEWMLAVKAAGYQVVPAQDTFRREARLAETRMALWRWLVAGLCMMQVMMYASPEYFARADELTQEMRHLMRWASWVLSLPVILFSCKPFFVSAWRDLKRVQVSMDLPVAIGMAITFVVSSLGTFEPEGIFGQEVYFDSLTMFVFFLLTGRWLELKLRDKTAGALEALINRMPDSVERLTAEGEYEQVPTRVIKLDDILRVKVGQSFPADAVLLDQETHVDEALLTGESKPVRKRLQNEIIAGSHNLGATVLIKVVRLGNDTRFAQIVSLIEQASTEKPHFAQLADRLAGPFLVFILCIAAGAGLYWWSMGASHAMMVAVAILIVTCPCALSLATPAAMLASAASLAKQGVLVRRLQAFETLSKVDTVIFDKTGTLTQDGLRLVNINTRQGVTVEHALRIAATLAEPSLHPVSKAIVYFVQQKLLVNQMTLEPLTMSQHHEIHGQGVKALIQSSSSVSEQSMLYQLGSAQFCDVPQLDIQHVQAHLSDSTGWLASFEFQELIRVDAQQTIEQLKQLGLILHLLSGDQSVAVERVANSLGITHFQGGCSPTDKLTALKIMQANGHTVAMVGDGLNDGPVLASAHVSFAFGRAVPLTQTHSDILVLGQSLFNIALTIMHARQTMKIVKQNLMWALFYNVLCIPLAIAGYMPAWLAGIGMATSSILVVANAMRLLKLPYVFKGN